MDADLPLIAITMGDPAGVGPEICLKVLADGEVGRTCVPVVFGDAGVLERVAELCRLPESRRVIPCTDWEQERQGLRSPAVVDCRCIDALEVAPGSVDEAYGRAAFAYIEAAIRAALAGEAAAVATGPINKESLRLAGVPYPGHTEIFTAQTGAARSCMMLTSEELTVSFVTGHVGLGQVPGLITMRKVLDAIELTAEAIARMPGRPGRLLVCGLNPHAGEHGLFGRDEEGSAIVPAVAAAKEQGILVEGPVPPDAAFLPARRRQADAVVCMYHDQGHIPLKMLAFDSAVNITLGLPIVRTSVDHGTAFDIAWQGRASAESLRQAVLLAVKLASRSRASNVFPSPLMG